MAHEVEDTTKGVAGRLRANGVARELETMMHLYQMLALIGPMLPVVQIVLSAVNVAFAIFRHRKEIGDFFHHKRSM
jgi:hypothetical protein